MVDMASSMEELVWRSRKGSRVEMKERRTGGGEGRKHVWT